MEPQFTGLLKTIGKCFMSAIIFSLLIIVVAVGVLSFIFHYWLLFVVSILIYPYIMAGCIKYSEWVSKEEH